MKKPQVIGFYGYSGSGKTTLIESLCRDLTKKGVRLAVVKQSDQSIRLDTPGKDTYRFQDAGAQVVALASKFETDIMINSAWEIPEIINLIQSATEIDWVIVESVTDPDIKKIRLGEIEERPNTIWTYDGDYKRLLSQFIKH